MFERLRHGKLDELLGVVHIVLQVGEGHLGLNHPKLRQVAACVRVLRAECGAEGVDVSQCARHGLSGKLAGHRKEGGLTEEVL